MSAYKGADAIGISFGEMQNATGLSATNTQSYKQVYHSTRTCDTNLLGCDENFPIHIRNFGFQSLSLERDDGPNEVGPGYLHTTKYTAADGAFDGNIKVFGCGGHPRC